jgi:hypothetical protein
MKINIKKNCHARHVPESNFIKLKIFRSERRRRRREDVGSGGFILVSCAHSNTSLILLLSLSLFNSIAIYL